MAAHALIGSVPNRDDWRRVGMSPGMNTGTPRKMEAEIFFRYGGEGGKVQAMDINSAQFFVLQVITGIITLNLKTSSREFQ